jgi:predicted glycosyltransferase
MIIPDSAVDGLNLIWHSDLVISGGGTMNREAAALGVPVYSIFRGESGYVDRYLSASGRLTMIGNVEDVRQKIRLKKWRRPDVPGKGGKETLHRIVDEVEGILKRSGRGCSGTVS